MVVRAANSSGLSSDKVLAASDDESRPRASKKAKSATTCRPIGDIATARMTRQETRDK